MRFSALLHLILNCAKNVQNRIQEQETHAKSKLLRGKMSDFSGSGWHQIHELKIRLLKSMKAALVTAKNSLFIIP
jgi:hypothetical protein